MDWNPRLLSEEFNRLAKSLDTYVDENLARIRRGDTRSASAQSMVDQCSAEADVLYEIATSTSLQSQVALLAFLKELEQRGPVIFSGRTMYMRERYIEAWKRKCNQLIGEYKAKLPKDAS